MVHVFPRSDAFDYGYYLLSFLTSGVFSWHSGYGRVRPGTLTDSGSPYSTGGYTYKLSRGHAELHDGYSFFAPIAVDSPNPKRKKVAAFSGTNQDGFNTLANCNWEAFMAIWGKNLVLDGTARGVFSIRALSGGINPQSFKTFGVVVRNTGASPQFTNQWSAGTDGMDQCDAYAFLMHADTTSTVVNFFLVRWNQASLGPGSSGSATVLASGTAQTINEWTSGNSSTFSPLGLQRPVRLSLSVTNSGLNPVLTCKVARWVSGSGWSGDQTVLSFTDNQTNKITLTGYCGFFMSGPDTTGNNPPSGYDSSRSIHICHSFEILDSSNNILMRDEFERAVPGLLYTAGSASSNWEDINGVSGRSLQALWIGDNSLYGGEISSAPISLRDLKTSIAGPPYVENVSTYAYTYGMAYNKPSESPYGSDRRMGLIVTTTGTWPSGGYFTIFGRGNPSSAGPNLPLYHFDKSYALRFIESGGSYRFEILHYASPTSPTVIGRTVLQSLASWGIVPGSTTTFIPRLALENVGQVPATGKVRIRAYQDSTQLDFTPATSGFTPPTGITFDGLDMIDERSNRTLSGSVEGFMPQASTGASGKKILLDYWNDLWVAPDPGDPTDPGNPAILEENMASIAVNSECTGKTGTLNVPYDWGIQEISVRRSIVQGFEANYSQRSVVHTRQRRRWKIKANAITDSERTTLLDFWTSHKGMQIPFDWADPETGSTVAVRFGDDSLGVTLANPSVRQFDFELEEVFC